MTDEQLAEAARSSPDALEALVLRHRVLVLKCARPLFLAGADHEDLVQEGMIGLLYAARSFDPRCGSSFQAYAAICIRSRLISAVRAAASLKHAPLNDSVSIDAFPSETADEIVKCSDPEEQLLRRESFAESLQFLQERLSSTERKVLGMYLEGLSYAEISKRLSKPVKSVDNTIQRIRKKAADFPGSNGDPV